MAETKIIAQIWSGQRPCASLFLACLSHFTSQRIFDLIRLDCSGSSQIHFWAMNITSAGPPPALGKTKKGQPAEDGRLPALWYNAISPLTGSVGGLG